MISPFPHPVFSILYKIVRKAETQIRKFESLVIKKAGLSLVLGDRETNCFLHSWPVTDVFYEAIFNVKLKRENSQKHELRVCVFRALVLDCFLNTFYSQLSSFLSRQHFLFLVCCVINRSPGPLMFICKRRANTLILEDGANGYLPEI